MTSKRWVFVRWSQLIGIGDTSFPQLIKLFALIVKLVENCAQARIIMRFIITSARNIWGMAKGVFERTPRSIGRFMNRWKSGDWKMFWPPDRLPKNQKGREDRLEIMDRRGVSIQLDETLIESCRRLTLWKTLKLPIHTSNPSNFFSFQLKDRCCSIHSWKVLLKRFYFIFYLE